MIFILPCFLFQGRANWMRKLLEQSRDAGRERSCGRLFQSPRNKFICITMVQIIIFTIIATFQHLYLHIRSPCKEFKKVSYACKGHIDSKYKQKNILAAELIARRLSCKSSKSSCQCGQIRVPFKRTFADS